jgi:methylphosphotriester-DNA--protein-cysteine methyltransferase
MAASSESDIPESKSDYCPCNRCTVARKQGRQEVIEHVSKLAEKFEQEPNGEMVSYHLAARRILTALYGEK